MIKLIQYRGIWVWSTIILLLGFAGWLAGRNIATPGLYYDEMLFINAAKGGQGSMFIKEKMFGVPVLLMDYIGALKAWLYYPLLKIFPVTPALIRYPAIVAGLVGAVFTALAFQKIWGKGGLLVGMCLIFDPALLMHCRLDWGPNALMFLLRGLLLWAIASWITDHRLRWLWLASASAALGIFDKLNFLWFAYAGTVALLICYHRELWGEMRKRILGYTAVGMVSLVIALYSTFKALSIQQGLGDPGQFHLMNRTVQALSLLKFTFAGGGVVDVVAGDGMRQAPLAVAAWLFLLIPALISAYSTRIFRTKAWWFLALITMGTLAAFTLTPTATGPHHSAMLAGLPILVLMSCFFQTDSGSFMKFTRPLRRSAACLFVVCMAVINYRCVMFFEHPTNRNWDPANQRASETSASLGFDCVTADWGLGTLVASYSPDPRTVHDDWPVFSNSESAGQYVALLNVGERVTVISHVPPAENLKGSDEIMRTAFLRNKWNLLSQRLFTGVDGRGLANVYTFEKQATRN